jgi:DNA-binding phage protein
MQLYVDEQKADVSARLMRVQSDLNEALKEFPRRSTGLKVLADNIGVHEKTLKRVITGSHSPSYKTILKIYRYLTGSLNDRDTVLSMPKILSEYICSEHENFKLSKDEVSFTVEVDKLIESDSIFRMVYLETGCGHLHKDKVAYECGQQGIRVLKKMEEMDIIREVTPDVFTASKNRASLRTESIVSLGKYLIESKFHEQKCKTMGENFCSVYFEGVNKETYNKLLIIDWEAKEQKKKLLMQSDSKGNIPYWSGVFTDTLSSSMIYDEKELLQ